MNDLTFEDITSQLNANMGPQSMFLWYVSLLSNSGTSDSKICKNVQESMKADAAFIENAEDILELARRQSTRWPQRIIAGIARQVIDQKKVREQDEFLAKNPSWGAF